MDLNGISILITTFGLMILAVWTLTSSMERAKRRDPNDSLNEFFALLLYRGLFFVITVGVIFEILDTKYTLMAIPTLLIGTFFIDRFGKD